MSRLVAAAPPPPSISAEVPQNPTNDRKFTSQDDHTSDLSSESSATSSNTEGTGSSTLYSSFGKYQDSDDDSGIVTNNHHDNRIGSTSSADTDVRQCVHPPKSVSLKPAFDEGYSSLKILSEKNVPIRGNHSIRSTEKINPQRLSLPLDSQLVRFEDDLQLSEQNVRRSCRKLFATLYAHQDMARNPTTRILSNPVETLPRKITSASHRRGPTKRHSQRHSMLEHSPTDDVDIIKVYARPASVIPDSDYIGLMECVRDINGNTKTTPERNSTTLGEGSLPRSVSDQIGLSVTTKSWDSYVDNVLSESTDVPVVFPAIGSTDRVLAKQRLVVHRERASSLSEPRQRDCAVLKVKAKVLAKSGSSTMPKSQVRSEETVPKAVMASQAEFRVTKRPPNVLELGLLTQRDSEGHIVRTTQSLWKDRPLVNSQPCLTFTLPRSGIYTDQTIPKKTLHQSDFALYQGPRARLSPCPSPAPSPAPELGRSRSFLDKVQVISRTARSAIQRAFSQERIYRPEQEERLEASGRPRKSSMVQGIKERVNRRKRKDEKSAEVTLRVERAEHGPDPWGQDVTDCTQVWGQLLQLNVDGSQVVELSRPHGKPFGFFVARGRVKNSKGVFVSRMRDVSTQKMFSGLLEVGDEILEIDGVSVKECDILEVNTMMGKKLSLLITVLPYHCRKDI